MSLLQDRDGFIWVGTEDGLNRYDGHQFKIYQPDESDPDSISGKFVSSLLLDRGGQMWVGTYSGLNLYLPGTDTFEHFMPDPADPKSISGALIYTLFESKAGEIWVGTDAGLCRMISENGQKHFIRYQNNPDVAESISSNQVKVIFEDKAGYLWLGTSMDGLNRFDPVSERFEHFYHDPADPTSLSNNRVSAICEDQNGVLWIGTLSGGLNRVYQTDGEIYFKQIYADPMIPTALDNNTVTLLFRDTMGTLWVGTWDKGLSRLEFIEDEPVFRHYPHIPADVTSLSNNTVKSMIEDKSGLLWVGTSDGLNYFDSLPSGFHHVQYNQEDNVSAVYETEDGILWLGSYGFGLRRIDQKAGTVQTFLPDGTKGNIGYNDICAILVDQAGKVWVGLSGHGIDVYDPIAESFTAYRPDPTSGRSLSNPAIRCIFEDSSGAIWIGTRSGLNRYQPGSDDFKRFFSRESDPNSLSHNDVTAIRESSKPGTLWVGTANGLNRVAFDSGRFEQFFPSKSRISYSEMILSIYEDSMGMVWIGTHGAGLKKLDPQNGQFSSWRQKDGLPNNTIYGVVEDKKGQLWMATNLGISMMDKQTQTFRNFGIRDGLHNLEFYVGAYFVNPGGEIFFGGTKGLTRFHPSDISISQFAPPMTLTDFRIANQPVSLKRYQEDSPLSRPIGETTSITLNHRQNMFSFDFASLDYTIPERNLYAYRMEGYDQDWIYTNAANRRATYTNLNPGNYTFHVKGSNHDWVWNEQGRVVQITLLPAPWWTWWAKSAYLLVILLLIFWYSRLQSVRLEQERRISHQQRQMALQAQKMAEQEHSVVVHLRQVDRLKDEFLANTSHELRTPLHGMIGLAESLLDGTDGELREKTRRNLDMIISAGKRLANLVNDILDFSQLKNQKLELDIKPVDLRALTDVVLAVIRPLVGEKDLQLVNAIPLNLPHVSGDENRLQQILYNLIGNAVKFSERGTVRVSAERNENMLAVQVSDTGIGIPEDKLDRIFISFEQVDGSESRSYGGTGLGLAVTRQLVELHGGVIWVNSKSGEGSVFTFTLPTTSATMRGSVRKREMARQDRVDLVALPGQAPLDHEDEARAGQVDAIHGSNFNILIVDDEPINRQILADHLLMRNYRITEVGSGREALAAFEQDHFDIVLLDVMMPRMTGYEVCRKLRERFPSHELPIIFLTAKSRINDLITGFDSGANDYLTKPVEKNELLSRVKTHLELLNANRTLEQKVEERTRDLINAQKGLIEAAHTAGMAEIATDVLHNVGNTVNSLKTSIQVMELITGDHKWVELLQKIAELLDENAQDLASFLLSDPRGKQLPEAIERIANKVKRQYCDLSLESGRLVEHIDRMTALLKDQEKYVRVSGHVDLVDVNQLVRESLQVGTYLISDMQVAINTELSPSLPLVKANRARFFRIILCLLNNACEAVSLVTDRRDGCLTIKSSLDGDGVVVEICDNGIGIPEENLVRIFQHGFTTKEGRRGFGLHYCANAIHEMAGSMAVHSRGSGQGAEVLIRFPVHSMDIG